MLYTCKARFTLCITKSVFSGSGLWPSKVFLSKAQWEREKKTNVPGPRLDFFYLTCCRDGYWDLFCDYKTKLFSCLVINYLTSVKQFTLGQKGLLCMLSLLRRYFIFGLHTENGKFHFATAHEVFRGLREIVYTQVCFSMQHFLCTFTICSLFKSITKVKYIYKRKTNHAN